ncbi:hypothetical protein FLA_2040 [Filimonas lacunae]|nr:hypothetical protein FLA_2040 [Filimonas lacunae]
MAAMPLAFTACKKEETMQQQVSIITPVISKLNRSFAQAGDTLVIYGASLIQQQRLTEVFINDRPCTLLKSVADSLQVLVPAQTRSGQVTVTISYGKQFSSAEGPSLDVKPTPALLGFWPRYGYAGESITLYVENFSIANADNHIFLEGFPATITGGNGKDTLLVTLPAASSTGVFSWRTYQGPLQYSKDTFLVRQPSYPVTSVGGWLQQDPAYTYLDTLYRGYPALSGSNYDLYARIYDSALNYINSPNRTYTVFLPADGAYYSKGITLRDYITKIKNAPYSYNSPMVAAILPDIQLSLADMHEGDLYNTAFTELMQWYPYFGSDDNKNKMQVTEEDGQKYVNLVGIYGDTRPRVKVIRAHKVGNATIIETDGDLGYIPFE